MKFGIHLEFWYKTLLGVKGSNSFVWARFELWQLDRQTFSYVINHLLSLLSHTNLVLRFLDVHVKGDGSHLVILEKKLSVCPIWLYLAKNTNSFFQSRKLSNNREIKHHVYRNRERQKYQVIMSFPPFSCLSLDVFNRREETCFRVP